MIFLASCTTTQSASDSFCTKGLEVIKLQKGAEVLLKENQKKVANLNCALHRVCGYAFKGDKLCPK